MKEESKKEIKKGVLTGAGTVAGAVVGVVVENTINGSQVEARPLQEVHTVEAIVEDIPQISEEGEASVEETSSSVEAMVADAVHDKPRYENKPVHHHEETIDSEIKPDVSLTAVEVEEAVPETEPEQPVVEAEAADEDIMVVSVVPEPTQSGYEEDYDFEVDSENISMGESLPGGDDLPDYADIKDGITGVDASAMSAMDMPDYVNDANIDSFTDNV